MRISIDRLETQKFFGTVQNTSQATIDISALWLSIIVNGVHVRDGDQEYVLRKTIFDGSMSCPSMEAMRQSIHLEPGESKPFTSYVPSAQNWVFEMKTGDAVVIPWEQLPSKLTYRVSGNVDASFDVAMKSDRAPTYYATGEGTLIVRR